MSEKELLKRIKTGKIKLHEVEKYVPIEKAVYLRRKALGNLPNIGTYSIDVERAMKKNVENMIGVAQVPMGVAGPVKIHGRYAKGMFYIPLATTEGALVASVSRGCKAINESGGADTFVLDNKMTRAPVFRADSIKKAHKFVEWVGKHFEEIKKETEKGSRFLKLRHIEPWVAGRNIFLRFECTTGDAMGMNMITIGAQQACDFIEKKTKVRCISVSGNMCVDKKPAALNFITGRGKKVVAEVVLKKKAVKNTLKTTPEDMAELCYRKCLVGSAQAGALGFNLHVANILAAMYIATGQDPAHVVDGSQAITLAENGKKGLHVSVTLPCIEVGTVGGGTGLGTQHEALKILKCEGSGKALKLAEIIGAAVLAGEISLMGAEAAHHLAKAHRELGR
ncbi:MAG: hydroxymethylglutaryl-CoA reductase (NADPH) [Candidatus Diapherotrites archaeon]|nr:hydroxymethylglutaryl-CoA reductase (NADPH) [Candidatus Diapherotrites archaeon]